MGKQDCIFVVYKAEESTPSLRRYMSQNKQGNYWKRSFELHYEKPSCPRELLQIIQNSSDGNTEPKGSNGHQMNLRPSSTPDHIRSIL
jgi:hypothetical protein